MPRWPSRPSSHWITSSADRSSSVSKGAERDWAKTGTVAAMAEWLRSKSDAQCVVVVRRDDAVLAADPRLAPADAGEVLADRLPGLVLDLATARAEKRKAARQELPPLQE